MASGVGVATIVLGAGEEAASGCHACMVVTEERCVAAAGELGEVGSQSAQRVAGSSSIIVTAETEGQGLEGLGEVKDSDFEIDSGVMTGSKAIFEAE